MLESYLFKRCRPSHLRRISASIQIWQPPNIFSALSGPSTSLHANAAHVRLDLFPDRSLLILDFDGTQQRCGKQSTSGDSSISIHMSPMSPAHILSLVHLWLW